MNTIQTSSFKGGRTSSAQYRALCHLADHFTGLENGRERYEILLLVKKVGKQAGFSRSMIALLDYYMAFTRDSDWEEGSNPIVYQSITRTALDLCLSERQVQRLEKSLFEVGALTWHDSGNHKRYGQRHPKTGKLLYAFGVDLSPLAILKEKLQNILHEKQLYDQAWMEAKRQISWYRAQVRGIIAEAIEREGEGAHAVQALQHKYNEIAVRIRTNITLSDLHALRDEHRGLYKSLTTPIKVAAEEHKSEEGSNVATQIAPMNTHSTMNSLDTAMNSSIDDPNKYAINPINESYLHDIFAVPIQSKTHKKFNKLKSNFKGTQIYEKFFSEHTTI